MNDEFQMMLPRRRGYLVGLLLTVVLLLVCTFLADASPQEAKQKAIAHWNALTTSEKGDPVAFVRGNEVRLCFGSGKEIEIYKATWRLDRAPTDKFRVAEARLRPSRTSVPEKDLKWQEARLICGKDAQIICDDLARKLTPERPGHGYSYECLFADRTIYRDKHGTVKVVFQKETPRDVVIDHHYYLAEGLEIIAAKLNAALGSKYPNESLFVLMPSGTTHYTQPVFIDRKRRVCVSMCLAALFDSGETGVPFKVAGDGISALILESHGLALLRNPISSVARLADGLVQDSIRLVRIPSVTFTRQFIPASSSGAMDLNNWEEWLDRHTGTEREKGSLKILVDGDEFFRRFRQAAAHATNHISGDVYIFDTDDVGVGVADLLKRRSAEIPVKVTYDRMCSLVGALLPKMTPMPADYVPPASIARYLRKGSQVQVRPFLNPWLSVNHSKLFLVDGNKAWIGGMNLGREYLHEWHDVMFEMEGPVVGSFEGQFDREWALAGPGGDAAYFAALSKTHSGKDEQDNASVRYAALRRLPTSKGLHKPYMKAVLTALEQARSYIWIENGYLFDKGVAAALVRAKKRGVDVRLILPRVNNFTVGIRSNLAIAERLRRAGVRVFLWPGMTHTKVVMVDGWSCFGSANLNQWSFRLSVEQNLATSDPEFASELKAKVFEADFARSYELKEPISVNAEDRVVEAVLSY